MNALITKLLPSLTGGQSLAAEILCVLLLVIAAGATGFGTGWHVRGTENASASFKAQKQEVTQGNVQNAKDAASAQQHDAKRQTQAAHDNRVAQAVAVAATSTDYHTCQLKPEDLQKLNDAITGGDDGKAY